MAYAHPYKYDVFLSYATADTREYGDAWLTETYNAISQKLNNLNAPGRPSIFLDRKQPLINRPLDTEIEQAARNSAVFIAFISENYLKSTNWCLPELKAWSQHRSSAQLQQNLFLTSLDGTTGTDLAGMFPWIVDWKHWAFFQLDTAGLQVLKIDSGINPNGETFQQLTDSIATSVLNQLTVLRSNSDAPRIYLAETSKQALLDDWPEATTDELEKYFEGEGIIVLRDRFPNNAPRQGALNQVQNRIASCHLFFQRLELSEDKYPLSPSWQQIQRDTFRPATPGRAAVNRHPVPLFWLPRGAKPPASWPQGQNSNEPETCTLEEARRRAVSRARAEYRRGALRNRGTVPVLVGNSPAPPWLDLLIVASDNDLDFYQTLLIWLEKNNDTLRQQNKRPISYAGVLGDQPLIEFDEFNGIIVDPWNNDLMCKAVMQVYGNCSGDDINKRQSHWLSLVQSPAALAHQSTLHGIYTAEFDPPPKQRRSTNLRHHQNVRINQEELMKIMVVL